MLVLRRILAALMTAVSAAAGGSAHMDALQMGGTCTMAEFSCRSEAQCIPLDQYCNGAKNCEDGSDEPPGCTPCNRTYYGRLGATYTLLIPKPTPQGLPHFCQLTFIASGFIYGDLIQLSFEKFNLGRFVSHTKDGCPDGHMQIEELSRPLNKGYWCGTSLGTNTYYSETSAVTIMIRVFNLTDSGVSHNPAVLGFSPEDIYIMKVSYKFLQRYKASLRYGGSTYNPYYRGKDVLRTFCDKTFENCDQKNCKIQSPNFPGMYPRNITCFYRIYQTEVPAGKVPLIRIRQTNPHLVYIKDVNAPHLLRERRLYLDADCHVIHDYLMIYDGNDTNSPLLLKFCKGGALSPITSSSSVLLLVFQSSPYDFPFQDSPTRKVYGFIIDVKVMFADVESTAYIRAKKPPPLPQKYATMLDHRHLRACEWQITSRGQRAGFIQAPYHSILPNTTCVWQLTALPNEIIWFYFMYYKNIIHEEIPQPQACPNTLSIHNGDRSLGNTTLMKRVCQKTKYPRVCSGIHSRQTPVACTLDESYITTGNKLSVSLVYTIGTIPAHIEFLARYEFVTKRQWGKALPGGDICDRTFGPRPDRLFASPRDIFMYGRGGRRKLSCVYTFKVEQHQRLTLRILRAKMGNGCSTVFRQTSKRHECSHGNLKGQPAIQLTETLWDDVDLVRACLCDISDTSPFVMTSYSNEIKLIFDIPYMAADKDFSHFFFEGDYEVVDAPTTTKGMLCKAEERHHQESLGNFTIGAGGIVDPCAFLPRLVTVASGAFIFMRVKGFRASETNCGVASRINIFAVGGKVPMVSICPEPGDDYTDVFSHGWSNEIFNIWGNITSLYDLEVLRESLSLSRDLLIEYTGNYSGKALVTWMEVWQPITIVRTTLPGRPKGKLKCPYLCKDIGACIPSQFWCDGIPHCPKGEDELAAACGILASLPWASIVAASALVFSLIVLLLAVILHKISTAFNERRRRRKERKNLNIASTISKKPPKPKPMPKPKPKPKLKLKSNSSSNSKSDESSNPSENDGAW